MAKILVSPRSITSGGHPALEKLKNAGFEVVFSTPGKQPTQDELLRLLPDCAGYLAGVEDINATVLGVARQLKVISRNGVGIDNVDLQAAAKQGIAVKRAVGANSRGVAELAMAHLLALARWVPYSDSAIKSGKWERRKGFELLDKTLGLIGCGHIGRLVAKFALGMDMKVLAFDVMPDAKFAPSPNFAWASLDDVLRKSHVISLHCPALPNGKALLDADAIACLRKGVYIINTARADLIDAAVMAEAIQRGHVAGLAVDVFKNEPPSGDPLAPSDRVIATPHIGGFTDESVDRAVYVAVDNLLDEL